MTDKNTVLLALSVIMMLLTPTYLHANQEGQNACITCHAFLGGELAHPVLKWKGSIHQQNDVTCDDCHGGSPDVTLGNPRNLSQQQLAARQALAMSPSKGFIGVPAGKAMFDTCGQCHSESVDRYANSIMGKAYLDDKGGPSCVTCHNAHHNSMPAVPKVCESCHKDTSGYDRIDPMNVNKAMLNALSGIRVQIAQQKARGKKPPLIPEFPKELGAFQIGFVAFGAVLVLLLIGYIIYVNLESRR